MLSAAMLRASGLEGTSSLGRRISLRPPCSKLLPFSLGLRPRLTVVRQNLTRDGGPPLIRYFALAQVPFTPLPCALPCFTCLCIVSSQSMIKGCREVILRYSYQFCQNPKVVSFLCRQEPIFLLLKDFIQLIFRHFCFGFNDVKEDFIDAGYFGHGILHLP